ncbi:hypothetical protein H5410_041654 [Solanum commersonii]|uniref:Uncharacterized protein n=1 Tax=Solanum commersonii TaxID=4109 RepID=A0A9J5XV69_SOLCO|nr:hypothetical protein H5410_041654 [Solanum commersonii]
MWMSLEIGQFDTKLVRWYRLPRSTTTTVAWSILHDDRIKNMRRFVRLKSKSLLHNRQHLLQEGVTLKLTYYACVANGVSCFKLLEVRNDRFDSQMFSEELIVEIYPLKRGLRLMGLNETLRSFLLIPLHCKKVGETICIKIRITVFDNYFTQLSFSSRFFLLSTAF